MNQKAIRNKIETLKTEINTPSMKQRILQAARKRFGGSARQADFEHGQWWITDIMSGAQYSVIDAEGPGSTDGFDFEQVTGGSE